MPTIFDTEPTTRLASDSDRTHTVHWTANPDGQDHFGDPTEVRLELRASHYNKAYSATVNIVTVSDGCWSTMPFDAITVLREPAPRYSAKNLATFAATALATLRSIAETDPVIQAKIVAATSGVTV